LRDFDICDSVAEALKQPLYSVSASELGIDPHEVEDGLQHVLSVSVLLRSTPCWTFNLHQRASTWNAVLLIDEADVLLEKRGRNDVSPGYTSSGAFNHILTLLPLQQLARNAMVAGALRLMEYHSGVLFLTTNRVESFDPASLTRVSIGKRTLYLLCGQPFMTGEIAIKYDELDPMGQTHVWRRFLLLARAIPPAGGVAEGETPETYLSEADVLQLAKHNLNGTMDPFQVIALLRPYW
jgi:ATPase family associated with various cellular activities (AAA)